MSPKKILATTVAVAAVAVAAVTGVAVARSGPELEAGAMVGIPAALTGTQNPQRNLNGGGLAWKIGESKVELRADGRVEVEFEGLVFAAGANLDRNTVDTMKVVVSCIGGDGAVHNVSTPTFPVTTGAAADGGGNGSIEAMVALPSPCIAPIVFVTNVADRWFAADGL